MVSLHCSVLRLKSKSVKSMEKKQTVYEVTCTKEGNCQPLSQLAAHSSSNREADAFGESANNTQK